ncbi:MAG TPA: flippase activity-associated protein Agl23 [Methanomicrobiales archaeon]|jgi:uncharacterized protein (TIGR03663 family)|nr:flippase activity-associated protein Agl23 [Methanomicrobiales archaeon]
MRRRAAGLCDRLRTIFTFDRLFLLILALAVFLRFFRLDFKLYHHDEAIHGWFSYRLLHEGVWSYDPSYHGPLLYYATAGMFWLLGDGDVVGRILPSLLGTLVVALVYPLYRMGYLDQRQTLVASLFLTLSPDLVYFSRFLRHDIFMLFFIMLLLVTLLAYIETGSRWYGLGVALAVAGGMACKEEFPVILLIFGVYFIYAGWKGRFRFPARWKQDLAIFTLIALAIILILYSSLGQHPEVLPNAAGWAIEHWTEMHEQCRLCGPWYFYLLLFVLYELPILLLAIVGAGQFIGYHLDIRGLLDRAARKIRHEEPDTATLLERMGVGAPPPAPGAGAKQEEFIGFCIWWMVLSMAFYAVVNEKVPWLIIPQLLPAVFVAVYRLTDLKTVIAVASVVFLVLCTWHTSFYPGDVNEPIVQVQNSEDLRGLFSQIDSSTTVAVASKNYWPLPWYYRGVMAKKLSYYGNKVEEQTLYDNDYDLVIAYDAESYPSLIGYTKRTIRLDYWFSLYDNENRLPEWYFLRDGKLGSMNFDLFTREVS